MPGVHDHPLCRLTYRSESGRYHPHRHEIYQHNHRFESGNGLGNPSNYKKEDLGDGRVDGMRIVLTINIRINRIVAQRGKLGSDRQIEIGIDSGRLDSSVPDITINIRREPRRIEGYKDDPKQRTSDQNDHESAGWKSLTLERQPNRQRKWNTGNQQPKQLPIEEVVTMRVKKAELHNQQQNSESAEDEKPSASAVPRVPILHGAPGVPGVPGGQRRPVPSRANIVCRNNLVFGAGAPFCTASLARSRDSSVRRRFRENLSSTSYQAGSVTAVRAISFALSTVCS